jgi:uncharacterized protein with PQ loop repeat
MVHDTAGMHHFHKRKRAQIKHKKYREPDKWKRFMDKAIYVVGIIGPIMTIPQLTKIWVEKNAAGVSVISWAAYLVTGIFWFIYAMMHKEKPLIMTYAIWIVLEIFIVVGTLMYG